MTQIRWTGLALHDFTHICDQSEAQFGTARARRTATHIYRTVNSLADFPHIGRLGRKLGTYELPIYGLPFLAVYRIKDDSVEIVRILHGAQKWP